MARKEQIYIGRLRPPPGATKRIGVRGGGLRTRGEELPELRTNDYALTHSNPAAQPMLAVAHDGGESIDSALARMNLRPSQFRPAGGRKEGVRLRF